LKQLFIQFPIHLVLLALSPIEMVGEIFGTTLGLVLNPKNYSERQKELYHKGREELEIVYNKNFKPSDLKGKISSFLVA